MEPRIRWSRPAIVLVILVVLALVSIVCFMTLGSRGNWSFVIPFRGRKLLGLLLVAYSIAISTVLFQTVTNNRIITPSIMGFESLYTVIQTGAVYAFGVAGVVENDRLAGVITDGDLRRNMDGLLSRSAGEVMTHDPRTIGPGALAEEAVAQMNALKITCLFVTDDAGAILGLIHIHDCLRAGVA